ncbi:hypothetical protein T05_1571, partial [Trichinella murrelli]
MAECEGLYTVDCREKIVIKVYNRRFTITIATGGQGYVNCMSQSGCSSMVRSM